MKRYLLLFAFLFLYINAYGSPSNTMSITPVAVDGATITASDENSRNNVVVTTYNAHTHTDVSQVANTLNVGDALAGNKVITAYNADTNKPYIKYDDTNNYWIFSTNGVAPSVVLQDTGITFEGTTDNEYETTLSITDPTADRTITIPNNTGTVPLSGASVAQTLTFSGDTISNLGTVTTADINGGTIGGVVISDVTSTTKVTNLNADLLDGYEALGAATVAGLLNRQIYTTSSGNWTCPASVTMVYVTMIGGGGSGGSADGNVDAAGGGGGGGNTIINYPYAVTATNTYAYSVGAGGAAPVYGDNEGNDGTNTTFGTGTVLTALGGNKGRKGSVHTGGAAKANTLSGSGTTAGYNSGISGGAGGDGASDAGGGGGGSLLGKGGTGGASNNGGSIGTDYGSGGGGAGKNTGANGPGGAGAGGIVILMW